MSGSKRRPVSQAGGNIGKLVLIVIIAVALAILIYLANTQYKTAFAEFNEVTVLIDAGHGGSDGGAVGVSGTKESDINLQIALRLKSALEQEGAKVLMVRKDENAVAPTKDEDMARRAEIIKTSGADIFVSIHQNKFSDPGVSGPQVFYKPGGSESEKLAKAVQAQLIQRLKPSKARVAMEGNYLVLRAGEIPSIMVECGFMSNATEERLLQTTEYQIEIARAITQGISQYLFSNGSEIAV